MNLEKDDRTMTLHPVGVVKSPRKDPSLRFEHGDLRTDSSDPPAKAPGEGVCEVIVYDEYSDCVEGLEEFSHIIILYWPHLAEEGARDVRKVHPAGQKDMPLVGVFATRSPVRPNPLCSTTVRLLERRGNVLKVQGLDAVDGSPVFDIKPHHPRFDAPGDVKLAGWMEELHRRMGTDRDG